MKSDPKNNCKNPLKTVGEEAISGKIDENS